MDEKAETSLGAALGKNIGFLFPEIEVSIWAEGFTTPSVSISLDHKSYLIIDNDWADTPDEGIDYYFLGASLSDVPKDIKVTTHSGQGWLHHRSSGLSTGDYNFVSQITIYEYSDSFETESVQYDAAILFEFENKKQILFSREETIAGKIEVNYKADIIQEILKTIMPRKALTSAAGSGKDSLINVDKNATRLKIRY